MGDLGSGVQRSDTNQDEDNLNDYINPEIQNELEDSNRDLTKFDSGGMGAQDHMNNLN